MIIVAQVFSAMQNVIEEKIFSKYNVNPMQATGIEGIAGMAYSLVMLPIFNNVACSTIRDGEGNIMLCPFGVLEDTMLAFRQVINGRYLAIYVLGYTVATVFLNSIGISIVKYTSSMERTVVSCLRIFLVWIVSILIGWESFIWLQLVGFAMIVLGMLIFSELLVLPFLGLDLHLKKNQKEDTAAALEQGLTTEAKDGVDR